MRYQMARAGWNHAPQCMLTPEQVKEFVPIMNIDKVTLHPFQSRIVHTIIDQYLLTMLNRSTKILQCFLGTGRFIYPSRWLHRSLFSYHGHSCRSKATRG